MAFGEVFVGALLEVLFEMLASGAIAQIQKYVKGKKIDPTAIKSFEDNLRMIAALLQDAEQRRIESAAFKIWVEKLQDLAYDLDDILDELATDAQLQLQQQRDDHDDEDYGSMARNFTCLHSAKTKVKSIIACGSRVAQRFHYSGGDLPSKIQEINNRLEQLQQQGQQNLGLLITKQDMMYPMEGTQQISGRETTHLANEAVLLGRDKKKREVICELLNEESGNGNYVVIPIVGKGGVGKTTLAQFVYNDQQLKDHFDIKAWVCVSDVFDVTRVTTDIINSSIKKKIKFNNLNEAQNELIEVIRNKKFLLVLDDIWNDEYDVWRELQTPFQNCAMGSKVIVTTRDRKIATMVRTNSTHRIIDLEGLLDEDCWRLFQHHANDEDYNNDLVEMKDDIINKCKGLPLAAKALGGLFRKTTEKSQRWMILNNNIWTEESKVLPVLRLSYYHLPPHLKHTFAFCCILPKDYEFEEIEVILLWMAQGFLIRGKEERFEDIGHLYFDDLVSRSLFERSPSTKKCYIMHDLVHDLAQWAASDICCCIMDMKDVQRDLKRTRHLVVNSNDDVDDTWRSIQPIAGKLRTLIFTDEELIDDLKMEFPKFLESFQFIRTLILTSETVELLPECVGDLKHLRLLDLKFTKIQALPNSIRKLCNLQVLFLDYCRNLREVKNIRFLVKLRHLNFHETLWEAMPWGVGNLTDLESLGGSIYLGVDNRSGSMIRELRRLNNLHGDISVIGMENVRKVDDAREAQLHEKKGITKMYLEWSRDREEIDVENEREVLEELRPGTCIEKLKLLGYMGMTLPTWLEDGSFKNMVSIELILCDKCVRLPQLGQLPLLKRLVLKKMNGIRDVGPSVFSGPSCLEEFSVVHCDSLIKVNDIPSSVVQLDIRQCPKLLEVEFKKSSVPSLATSSAPNNKGASIYIERCESLVTVGRIPLTVQRLIVFVCKKVKYMLFGDMTFETEEQEEDKEAVGGTEEETDHGVGSSIKEEEEEEEVSVSEKQIPIELSHLLTLNISNCDDFRRLPQDLLLPSVKSIVFRNNEKQEALPEQLHTFTSLEDLSIMDCPKMRRFPKGGLPTTASLKSVVLHEVSIEQPPIGEWGFNLLPHLETLMIGTIGSSSDGVDCIPGPNLLLHLPSSLLDLTIWGFENLKSIHCSYFPNLTHLYIYECPKLENLDEYNFRPPNLKYAQIFQCPMIQRQCQPDPNGLIRLDFNDNQRCSIIGSKLLHQEHTL